MCLFLVNNNCRTLKLNIYLYKNQRNVSWLFTEKYEKYVK